MERCTEIAKALSTIDSVDAVALAGSSSFLINDLFSDYDMYVYSDSGVSLEDRRRVLDPFGETRIGNDFFEDGDEVFGDRDTDIMYRTYGWMEDQIRDVWIECRPRLGYTTCFIHNLRTSRILFDRTGRLSRLQEMVSTPYPELLRRRIIEKNLAIIDGDTAETYCSQLEVACRRGDIVSMNHRLSALLASYFDIIFAYSRLLHPGEKKLLWYPDRMGAEVPESFESDIRRVLEGAADPQRLMASVRSLVDNLRKMLGKEA